METKTIKKYNKMKIKNIEYKSKEGNKGNVSQIYDEEQEKEESV